MSSAGDRIEASRAQLRLAMAPPPPAASHDDPVRPDAWLHRLGDVPLLRAIVESVRSWWSHHPLRPVTEVAGEASNAVVRPVAERHPLTLVLGAALVGAGVAWARPWRWLFRSALFAGLLSQLASRVVSKLPIESWVSMAGAAFDLNRRRSATPARETARPDAAAA